MGALAAVAAMLYGLRRRGPPPLSEEPSIDAMRQAERKLRYSSTLIARDLRRNELTALERKLRRLNG